MFYVNMKPRDENGKSLKAWASNFQFHFKGFEDYFGTIFEVQQQQKEQTDANQTNKQQTKTTSTASRK